MKDFNQTDPSNMYYGVLAQGVKHFKETEGGREQMCEAVEEYAEEYAREYAAKKNCFCKKSYGKYETYFGTGAECVGYPGG